MKKNLTARLLPLVLFLAFSACRETNPPPPPPPVDSTAAVVDSTADSTTAVAKLNLNTASDADFLKVPGVDDHMVHEFTEYRPYKSIKEFRKEIAKYVSETQVAEYEKYVYVPIDPNKSDKETLQQIAGVDAAEADQLIAARPYVTPAAFLDKLTGMVTPEDKTVAQTYLVQ